MFLAKKGRSGWTILCFLVAPGLKQQKASVNCNFSFQWERVCFIYEDKFLLFSKYVAQFTESEM